MATVLPGGGRPGRWAELFLLVFALGLSFLAYAQVALAATGALPAQMATQCGGFTLLALAFHLVLRWRAPYADPVILPVTVLLNGMGLAMIYRLALRYEQTGANPGGGIASRQLIWTVLGVLAAAAVVVVLRDHRILRRFTYTAMLLGLVGLVAPLLPFIGWDAGSGSRIWVRIGPLSIQPAEVSKILLVVFFAGYLVARRDAMALAGPRVLGLRLPRLRDMGPILLAWLASLGVLVFERDLGTSLLLFGIFVVMLYVATNRPSWIVIGLALFGGGVVAAYRLFGHVQARLEAWLHPFDADLYNAKGGSHQLVQGLFGMANGGLFGTGWGRGRPDITPLAYSDFIFTSLGEELGLTGSIAILLVYLILVERGFRTAIGIRDGFGKLLATGLTFTLAFQLFVVVGGVTRVIPLTGLVTPFLAYGGSALLMNWVGVALLLRVSDGARRPPPATSEIDLNGLAEAAAKKGAADHRAAKSKKGAAADPDALTEVVRRP
ncbi:MAG: FtsW/RodA/SpoVE family cell cycle protein [Bifidobacteriaceae bacterium]|nr:FtsW/RodA/SpoVE family cell cycle protein [Bifidobacteriaceae bacterium]